MEESRFYITPFTCLLTGPFQPHSSWGHRLSFNPSRPGKRIYLYVPEQMAKCSQHFCLLSALAFHGSCFPAPPPPVPGAPGFFLSFPSPEARWYRSQSPPAFVRGAAFQLFVWQLVFLKSVCASI